MCQRLYVASRTELARVRKTKAAPFLELRPLGNEGAGVRRHFPAAEFPHLYVAEAFAPCGCGFPEELGGSESPRIGAEERATMERLREVLRPVARGRPRLQLFLCFLGNEAEEIAHRRTLSLAELESPTFRFRDLEILTVVKDGMK
jgi:hypothetical protein